MSNSEINICIITTKKPGELSMTNGHELRLIHLQHHDKNRVLRLLPSVNIAADVEINSKCLFVIDIPGISFLRYLKICSSHRRYIGRIMLQDSFFRYNISRAASVIKYQSSIFWSWKLPYYFFRSLVDQIFFAFIIQKIGFVSSSDIPFAFFKNKYQEIPNGVSALSSLASIRYNLNPFKLEFIFWGDLGYEPNRLSLKFFLDRYWHAIKVDYPNVTFSLWGVNASSLFDLTTYPDVILRGEFRSLDDIVHENSVFLNLVEFGSGVKNKTLEAVANSIPMLASRHSVEGIPCLLSYKYQYHDYRTLIQALSALFKQYQAERSNMANDILSYYSWINCYKKYLEFSGYYI